MRSPSEVISTLQRKATSDINHRVPVYTNDRLDKHEHSFLARVSGANKTLVLFDYILDTAQLETSDTSPDCPLRLNVADRTITFANPWRIHPVCLACPCRSNPGWNGRWYGSGPCCRNLPSSSASDGHKHVPLHSSPLHSLHRESRVTSMLTGAFTSLARAVTQMAISQTDLSPRHLCWLLASCFGQC